MANLTLLERLVDQDFGYERSGSRWGRSSDHSSLVIDSEKQVFYYNAEGLAGSTLDYLIKVRKMSYVDAKEYLKSIVDYTDTYIHHHVGGKEVVTYPPLVDSFHEMGKYNRTYFYDRKISDESIDRFRLGFWNNWFTVPMYEDGILKNIQLRKDKPKKEMSKYYGGTGASLFNSDILKITNEVFYTEGPLDAIAMIQNEGVPTISSDSGGAFLPEWLVKFGHIKKIYIVFDADSAGIKEAVRVAKMLGETRCRLYNFWDHKDDGYDPVDFFRDGRTGLVEIVKSQSKFSFELDTKERK